MNIARTFLSVTFSLFFCTQSFAFSYPAALNTNAATDTGFDYSPQLTTDDLGAWIATWYSNDDLGDTIGTDLDILYAVLTIVTLEEDTGAHGGGVGKAQRSSGGGTCFIATAAYGTPMANELQTLRTFRNENLLTNTMGTSFVDT